MMREPSFWWREPGIVAHALAPFSADFLTAFLAGFAAAASSAAFLIDRA